MPRTVLIDVDTGTDDALALLYAVAHPAIHLAGISCVAGNSGLDQVVLNTKKVLDAAGAPDIPIAAGARSPFIERARPEGHFHGEDGLGGILLPDTDRLTDPRTAVEMLRDEINNAPHPVTLVALAPQTNIAMLLTLHPDVIDRIERIVFMGGAAGPGNVTAVAEFNVWQDPEAASCVIESPVATTMYGWDVFKHLAVDQRIADRWESADHPAIALAGELLYRRGARSDSRSGDYVGLIGDAGALVMLTHPELFETRRHPVRVNLAGLGRGQTIVDQRPIAQDAEALSRDPWPLVDVALDLDAPAAAAAYVEVIESYAAGKSLG